MIKMISNSEIILLVTSESAVAAAITTIIGPMLKYDIAFAHARKYLIMIMINNRY